LNIRYDGNVYTDDLAEFVQEWTATVPLKDLRVMLDEGVALKFNLPGDDALTDAHVPKQTKWESHCQYRFTRYNGGVSQAKSDSSGGYL